MYGIEFEGKLLSFSVSGVADHEFCNSYECSLTQHYHDEPVWLTPNREYAEKALKGKTSWFNSSIDHPSFDQMQFPGARVIEVVLKLN